MIVDTAWYIWFFLRMVKFETEKKKNEIFFISFAYKIQKHNKGLKNIHIKTNKLAW